MRKKLMTMSETLRKKVMTDFENGESFRAIERDTGVLRQSLMKFVRGETSLRLDVADKLARRAPDRLDRHSIGLNL